MKPTTKQQYATMQAELEKILAWFEGDDLDIDKATEQYKRALQLVADMEVYLKTAENNVTKIKQQFGGAGP